MNQELVVSVSVNQLVSTVSYKHHASLNQWGKQDTNQKLLCPALYDCLGYQACLVKFNYAICLQDLGPSIQKAFLLTIICYRDEMLQFPHLQKQRDFVLHIYYTPKHGQVNTMKENSVNPMKYVEWPEDLVFNGDCSLPTQMNGYFGICSGIPPPEDVIKKIWMILGRLKSHHCMQEFKEIFCSFQYNAHGLCVPSIFHNKDSRSDRVFNFRSLPQPGLRLNSHYYKQFLLEHHASLVPSRLAFMIMVKKDAISVVDLLTSIYREQFLYVIHVDSQAFSVREDLLKMLLQSNFAVHNVFILPSERSFPTPYSSYEFIRAELEGFEELLRLGLWDFVINLSGEALPLRNIDDLAIALAPSRGLSFLSSLLMVNSKNSTYQTENESTFHICAGFPYNMTFVPKMPSPNELEIYTAPRWGTFSRDFIEYLVDEKLRSSVINKYQFFLQTQVDPDKSYIPTVLMNSPFRNSLRLASIHESKCFVEDSENLYQNIPGNSDTYKQDLEPSSMDNFQELISLSHRSFFGRIFPSFSKNNIRKSVLNFAKGFYYGFFEKLLPHSILKILAENIILQLFTGRNLPEEHLVLQSVLNLQVTPSLVPHDICCRSMLLASFKKIIDFNYWLDFSVLDKRTGSIKKVRTMLEPTVTHRFCYPDGNLRMVFISSWVMNDSQTHFYKWLDLNQTLPLPYGPAFSNGLNVFILLAQERRHLNCTGSFTGMPVIFENGISQVAVNLKLISPDKSTRCIRKEYLQVRNHGHKALFAKEKLVEEAMNPYMHIHQLGIRCGEMEPGPWILQLNQVEPSKSRIYSFPFYLIDFQNSDFQQVDILKLWSLKYFSFLSENSSFDFHKDETVQKNLHFSKQEWNYFIQRKFVKKVNTSIKKIEMNNFQQEYNIKKVYSNENMKWFICSGGVTSIVGICLAVSLWFFYKKYHFQQKLFLVFVPSLVFASLLQIFVFIFLCKK